jgi:hypothetical protein
MIALAEILKLKISAPARQYVPHFQDLGSDRI